MQPDKIFILGKTVLACTLVMGTSVACGDVSKSEKNNFSQDSTKQVPSTKIETASTKSQTECTESLASKNLSNRNGFSLPIFKQYCYSDKSGQYILYFQEKQDKHYDNDVLSTTIEARIFQIEPDDSQVEKMVVRDTTLPDEAGVNFWSRLSETKDIDADGLIEPIFVYGFYTKDDAGNPDDDTFSGRVKIIVFYKSEKIVIRAITGHLDNERSTVASDNFFLLPKVIQEHLIKKMASMYKNGDFGFDNSHDFMPSRK